MSIRRILVLIGLFVACNAALIGWGAAVRSSHHTLRATFLNVGQGDSAVIETPSGHVLVVDTGGIVNEGRDDQGRRVLLPFLRGRGINSVDILVLTHPDADHIGGAPTLLSRVPVRLLMDDGAPTDAPIETRLLTIARERGVKYKSGRRGEEIDFGNGVTASVLAPTEQEAESGSHNDASVVLSVRYGRTTLLLTGDAEAEEEEDLVESGEPVRCDLLKVAHHGSRTSTTPEFLAAARPTDAVISVGRHNSYGHPSPEVLERLTDSGARVYRTDRSGSITAESDGVTLRMYSDGR